MSEGEIEAASVSQLVRAVEETKSYAFLVGAGASTPEPAGIPLAGELVERWREEQYGIEDADFEEWVETKVDDADVDERSRSTALSATRASPSRSGASTRRFDELDSRLETADLAPDEHERVEELIDLLRDHEE